jgi:hypothetical protein
MSLLAICQWIQDTPASTALRESTWGFPILGALHVLGIAWFGGALFFPPARIWRRIGLAAMLGTGVLLFYVEPLKCFHSVSFWIKMALLGLIGINPVRRLSLALWAAMIFAARGIAFFIH